LASVAHPVPVVGEVAKAGEASTRDSRTSRITAGMRFFIAYLLYIIKLFGHLIKPATVPHVLEIFLMSITPFPVLK
jgi:hypothetical protein